MTQAQSNLEWNFDGVLPPINPLKAADSGERSPYPVPLTSFVERFAHTPARKKILVGLLRYRKALHELGLTSGFQWVDGSFLENIEALESRSPRDLDVVTFFHLPPGVDQRSLLHNAGHLFDPCKLKEDYAIDGYHFVLGAPIDAIKVKTIAYWYSLWSHRRSGLWKGFVQLDLDSAQDIETIAVFEGCDHD